MELPINDRPVHSLSMVCRRLNVDSLIPELHQPNGEDGRRFQIAIRSALSIAQDQVLDGLWSGLWISQ